uniref:Uncharacterized protein n=1 Tax=Avena sativa TaxID=4498 RepID=A0ACD5TB15_AVESA
MAPAISIVLPPVVNTILSGIQFVRSVGNENKKLQGEMDARLSLLEWEFRYAKWDITNYEGLDQKLAVDMQELLFHIEDFICDLSIREGIAASWDNARGSDSRLKYIPIIDSFIMSIKTIQQRQAATDSSSQRGGTKEGTSSLAAPDSPYYARVDDLVGFGESRVNIQELLSPEVDESLKLRVVSILGCNGVGKTALARAVFEASSVVSQSQSTSTTQAHEAIAYDCKAWVVASKCKSTGDLLNKVMEEVHRKTDRKYTPDAVLKFLHGKRYLVIIDDLQPGDIRWEHIKYAFPVNFKGSKIIVTTSVHSIARTCSSASYYVYPMKCLSPVHSNQLFCEKVYGRPGRALDISDTDRPRLERICEKCGCLPLALISAANYMGEKGQDLSEARCKDVCKTLGKYLESKKRAFDELKIALTQRYENLPNNDCKNCLLYVSMFPRGHQISSKSIARRLIAEEFLAGSEQIEEKIDRARRSLEVLIDRTMIEPVIFRNNSEVAKRCEVHGAMLDFIIQMSLAKNLVTLIGTDNDQHGNHGGCVRRLTIQSSTQLQYDDFLKGNEELIHLQKKSKLSSVRSLAIFNSGILDFKSCKMMRVLDLDGCDGVDETVLRDICELAFLKYLKLRQPSIREVPKEIKNLKHLQTLDTGDTPEAILLPVVVIMLPELAYLFGRFELLPSSPPETRNLERFLESKSELHTLAGIVKAETGVLETIIQRARKLKKVKLWRTCTSSIAAAAAAAVGNIHAPAPTIAPATRGNSKPWALFRSIKLMSKVPIPKHAASNGKTPSTKLSRNPAVMSPHPQPSASTSLPLSPSDNSVATTRLPGILVSSQLESLYIDSSGFCKAFLASLQAPCSISSIKLRGQLACLPDPNILKDLRILNKLHLALTGLSCQALSALQKLVSLEYLTIVEETDRSWNDSFIVEIDGFPCLKVLCFEGPKHPRLEIEQGAMKQVTTLKLLCNESPATPSNQNGNSECPPGVNGITHLAKLNEVILHHQATDKSLESWKNAAKCHGNMPRVMKQPTP